MNERGPFDYHVLTYLWVFALSAFSGCVNWMRKLREGKLRPFNVVELLGELATSTLAGLLTFWLCEWANIDKLLAAVFIAISGHMGTRAIFLMEKFLEARAKAAGIDVPKDKD